jgi:hypothetical protein
MKNDASSKSKGTMTSPPADIYKVGFIAGLLAFASTVSFCLVQFLQLFHVITYPLDGILIYSTSLCIVIPFVLEILALHYATPLEKQLWSHAAVLCAVIYAVFVSANYVVQLATVIPMSLKGKLLEVQILDQTPHSLFWNFDALGYIFMGLATMFAVPVFAKTGIELWVRRAFLANGLVTLLITFVYFYPTFSERLLLVGFPWAITAPGSMLLLALLFFKSKAMIRTEKIIPYT